MTKAEIFENLMLPLKASLTSESWEFLLSRGQMFIEQSNKNTSIQGSSAGVDWKDLRDKFFKECTDNIEETGMYEITRVNTSPHDLFEWFKKEIYSASIQGSSAEIIAGQVMMIDSLMETNRQLADNSAGVLNVDEWYHSWMKKKNKSGIATINVLDMLKDFSNSAASILQKKN